MDPDLTMTRASALDRLAEAIPRCGLAYVERRNTDAGPGGLATTSLLSPFLRRRLVLEQEAIAAAIAAHGAEAAAKFVEEIFWRAYFKGYLETHPAIWKRYLGLVAQGEAALAASSGLRRGYDDAVAGRTGIEGFDDWARDLVETGWLHNHARMWFASIWIFTLRLPWALGANFFLRHLIDGDPASNTLSWRWVAGLHTRGKAYVARADNIRRFTEGRFSPRGLNETPVALEEAGFAPLVGLTEAADAVSGDVALLLHLDDLHPENLLPKTARVVRVGGMVAHATDASQRVRRMDDAAVQDGLERAARHFGCPAGPAVEPGWARGLPVVTAWAPVGPSADALPATCLRMLRQWDSLAWAHASRGYFQVKSAIPAILAEVLRIR
jgi:deoxyribodipyrimidine photo-lyase